MKVVFLIVTLLYSSNCIAFSDWIEVIKGNLSFTYHDKSYYTSIKDHVQIYDHGGNLVDVFLSEKITINKSGSEKYLYLIYDKKDVLSLFLDAKGVITKKVLLNSTNKLNVKVHLSKRKAFKPGKFLFHKDSLQKYGTVVANIIFIIGGYEYRYFIPDHFLNYNNFGKYQFDYGPTLFIKDFPFKRKDLHLAYIAFSNDMRPEFRYKKENTLKYPDIFIIPKDFEIKYYYLPH